MRAALDDLARRQGADGAWAGDYGGPSFLLPMYVALLHAARQPPDARRREGMIRYLSAHRHADGSVGLHAEDRRGSMFTTALVYVALRLLGVDPDDGGLVRTRRWIHEHGTPLAAAPWGKLTLCLLGLYDWRGIHPILPELWLLPAAAPIHPRRLWCHCRQVYLPMAWLYGQRATIAEDALVRALRDELYGGRFEHIDWPAHKDTLASEDGYGRATPLLRAANAALNVAEANVSHALRRRALEELFEHICYEDEVTNFIDIGPVNKILNAFVHYFADPEGERFPRALAACELYVWDGHDGTKVQGYNSSKLWDTAFALQASLAAPADAPERARVIESAYGYVRDNQILEDVPRAREYYRDPSRGGWPFSNRAHGWPITDCTAEGLKCALALEGRFEPGIPEELARAAVQLILRWQNDDGGWATYERQRGGSWLELLNPSRVFGDIMVDYSYVECTSACLQALASARKRFGPEPELERAMALGSRFLRRKQRRDGSFEGSWGVCFTYGTWFGVSGLLAAGAGVDDPAVRRACAFLLHHQRSDGGWGEDGESCRERRYVQARAGSVVQTAWSLMALVRARHRSRAAQQRAVAFLVDRQAPDGGWPREPLVGVFNRTCLINYDNYRRYFPLWALGEWASWAAGAAPVDAC